MSSLTTPLAIQVIADFVCPWCLIGTRNLRAAIAEAGLTDRVTIEHLPFLLSPTTPVEGADLRETLRARYGGDPEAMFRRVEEAARSAGIPLDFSKVRRSVNTVAAHTLLAAAPEDQRDALASALYDAYFLEGRDIGNHGVLVEIGAAHGVDPDRSMALLGDRQALDRTRTIAREISMRGVQSVPFMILDGKLALQGGQPVTNILEALKQLEQA